MPPKLRKRKKNLVRKNNSKQDGGNACVDIKKEPDSPPNPKPRKKKRCRVKKDEMKIIVLTNPKNISCQECTKRFKYKNNYIKHLQLEHSKLPTSVACKQCPVRCPDSDTLKDHVANVHDRETFECPGCKQTFVRQTHVQRHMAQKGCLGKEITLYPCEICNANFTRKDNLMYHLRVQHIQSKDFKCKVCPYHTQSFSKLVLHTQKLHTKNHNIFECDMCGKVTNSRAAMCKHLEIHGEKKYACNVCGYRTHTVEVMRRHVLTHVDHKPFKCEMCSRSFIQRAQLNKHMERHTASYVCSTCGKKFRKELFLEIHQRVHSDENNLLCPVKGCSESNSPFANKDLLKKHLKKHKDANKPFTCEVCRKSFALEAEMQRHESVHLLERPRRCMYCVTARAYVRGSQLVKHIRKAHPTVFKDHLQHVRDVLNVPTTTERVKKGELDSILNMLDAETERILQGYGEGVLYGGMQDVDENALEVEVPAQKEDNPLMSEQELSDNLSKLLVQLIDKDLLECFGWPEEDVDTVLGRVIANCGATPADSNTWTRVQCLRENAKLLFLHVIEDKNISCMLGSHTIDQIVKHILTQVSEDDNEAHILDFNSL